MGKGFKHGGAPDVLNFSVVPYATEALLDASATRDNTIGIVTSEVITGWIVSSREPESPKKGLVWIRNGNSDLGALNLITGNGILLHPASACQHDGSKWVTRVAKTYKNSKWHAWRIWLYNQGDECTEVTGGWNGKDYLGDSDGKRLAPTVTKQSGFMSAVFKGMTWDGAEDSNVRFSGGIFTEKAVNLTGIDSLNLSVTGYSLDPADLHPGELYWGISDKSEDQFAAAAKTLISGVGTYSLDVSDVSGSYFLFLHCKRPTAQISVTFNEAFAE